ncbi:MAG TPA: hypothetical protein VGO57_02805 [Verrucomicrobiae bacterium]|jgi:hypothetical protein
MTFTKLKSHFINWREWELNPIVIKELRQAVRSWAVTGMLILFLSVLFIASLGFLVTQSFSVDTDLRLGGTMFSAFTMILAVASVIFIPLYVGVRVGAERVDNNPDLLYVSTLSPGRIIRGKFFCGAYMALLFFSACMPFMAFTNLLRGVDLPTVFFVLFFLFLVVCLANMFAIFLACLPLSRPFKILFALIGFIALCFVITSVIGFTFSMMRFGLGGTLGTREFWGGVATAVGIGLGLMGLFYFLAVALISPPSMNRALPVRIYLTVIWFLGGLLTVGWAMKTGYAQIIGAWAMISFVLQLLSLLVVISNADQLSARVRRDIPQGGGRRAVAFLFFNGAAGGLLWVAILSVATFFATKEVLFLGETWSARGLAMNANDQDQFFTASAATLAYAFAYALTALLIQRNFFPKRSPKLAGLLCVLLAGAWAVLPSIVFFFLNQLSWRSVESLQLGNVFNIFSLREDERRVYHLFFAMGWLILMIVLNANWFARQAKNFRPAGAGEVPPPLPQ